MTMREKSFPLGNGFLMIEIHPMGSIPPTRTRGDISSASSESKKRNNKKNRIKKLTRLIHANFVPGGLVLHLTYKSEPDEKEAKNALGKFLRNLRLYYERHGLQPLKYIAVTERGQENGRIHHHVIINDGIGMSECKRLWTNGLTRINKLYLHADGVCALGNYLLKAPIGAHAWCASKGLLNPEPNIRDGRISPEIARYWDEKNVLEQLYPGYAVAAKEGYISSITGGAHISAMLREKGRN